jgi:hypothetical protein
MFAWNGGMAKPLAELPSAHKMLRGAIFLEGRNLSRPIFCQAQHINLYKISIFSHWIAKYSAECLDRIESELIMLSADFLLLPILFINPPPRYLSIDLFFQTQISIFCVMSR